MPVENSSEVEMNVGYFVTAPHVLSLEGNETMRIDLRVCLWVFACVCVCKRTFFFNLFFFFFSFSPPPLLERRNVRVISAHINDGKWRMVDGPVRGHGLVWRPRVSLSQSISDAFLSIPCVLPNRGHRTLAQCCQIEYKKQDALNFFFFFAKTAEPWKARYVMHAYQTLGRNFPFYRFESI